MSRFNLSVDAIAEVFGVTIHLCLYHIHALALLVKLAEDRVTQQPVGSPNAA